MTGNWFSKLFGHKGECKCEAGCCGKEKEIAPAPIKMETPVSSAAGTTAGQPDDVVKNQ